MKFDYAVKYDPTKDTQMDVIKRIFYSIYIRRLKGKFPVRIFIKGGSGSGKSQTAAWKQWVLSEILGIDYNFFLENIKEWNIFTPLEYADKIKKIIYDKKFKKIPFLCIHEARDIVPSNLWRDFVTVTISHINQQLRNVKRTITIIISQSLGDITKDMRKGLDFYVNVSRGNAGPVYMQIHKIWLDERDLDNIRTRKRRLHGFLVYPDGKWRSHRPKNFVIRMPPKEISDAIDVADREAKKKLIDSKLNDVMEAMKKAMNLKDATRVDPIVDHYVEHPEELTKIGKRLKTGFKMHPKFKQMYALEDDNVKEFQEKLNERLKERGIIDNEQV